jgi:mono/diheme cytochrome c family protein
MTRGAVSTAILLSLVMAGAMLLLAVILWLWPRPASPKGSVELPAFSLTVLAEGRELYASSCASCHGQNGEGSSLAPGLDASMFTWQRSDQQLKRFLRHGRGAMPAVATNWSDDQVEAVLVHIKQWWDEEQLEHQTRISR